MAQWCFLLLATCFATALGTSLTEETLARNKEIWEKCKKQENAPEAAMNDLFYFKSVEGLNGHKCVFKCILEEYDIFNADGTINKEKVKETVKHYWKEPEIQEKIIKGGKKCLVPAKANMDSCEYNYNIFGCYINLLKEEGITVNKQNSK